jgi:cyanophycinase-like exopeptidase
MSLALQGRLPGGLLALVGSGEYLPGMQPVDGKLMEWLNRPAKVVCLPTAAGTEGAERVDYWSQLGVAHFTQLGAASVRALPIIDHASANRADFAAQIREANFVYLSGGKPAHLYDSLAGTLAWRAIESVLINSGIVAGCSAGAMIFGAYIPRGRSPLSMQAAFDFLPGSVILPHYDELPGFLQHAIPQLVRDYLLVGIEGYTALLCTATGCQVLGRGCVTLARRDRQMRFCSGAWLPA